MSIEYRLYWNGGNGGPIDWTTVIATVAGTSWSPPALAAPSDNSFGIHAFDTTTGIEEQSTDATCRIRIAADGTDITKQPNAPISLSVTPAAAGELHVTWQYNPTGQGSPPTGFHVYVAAGAAPACTLGSEAATTPYGAGRSFYADIPGGVDGTRYYVIVRAYNAAVEETNTNTAACTADAAGPLPVRNLSATAI